MTKRRRKTEKARGKQDRAQLFFFFFGCLILILPVFYLPQAMDRTLMPRMLFLSIVLLLCTPLLFSKQKLLSWEFNTWRNPVFLLVAGYLVVALFAACFAANSQEIYFDLLRNILFLSGLAYATAILQNTKEWPVKLSALFLITAAVAVLIGSIQYVSRVHLAESALLPDGRALVYSVTGLFSHKNFFSSALFLMLPFVGYGVYKFRKKYQMMAIVVTIAILVMIMALGTRSVWLGLFVGVATASVLLLIYPGRFGMSVQLRKWFLMAIAATLLFFLIVFVSTDPADDFSFSGRVLSIVDVESQHNIHRINIWKGTLAIIQENPIIGVGPGNWMIHIPAYFDHNFDELRALGWSQPHNDFLWIAAEKGVTGLLFFSSFYLVILVMLFRILLSSEIKAAKEQKVFALLLLIGLLGYLTDSFFSFPYERMDVMVLHMILIASVIVLYNDISTQKCFKPLRKVLLMLLIPLFIFSAIASYQSIRMENHLGKALNALRTGNYRVMLKYAETAKTPFRSLGPHLYPPEFLEGVAYQNMHNPAKAVESFELARQQAPNDIRILHLLAINYIEIRELGKAFDCFQETVAIFSPSQDIITDMKRLSIAFYESGNLEQTHNTLLLIPDWEDDPEVARNIQIIEEMMQSERESQ